MLSTLFSPSSIDAKEPNTLRRRRRGAISKGPFLFFSSSVILYPSLMQRSSSFSVKSTTAKQLSQHPKNTAPSEFAYTSFQFHPNGTCIVPQLFATIDKPKRYFTMQNVPGDGDCMFLAVALAATKSATRKATAFDLRLPPFSSETGSVPISHFWYNTTNDNSTTTADTATAMAMRHSVADVLEMSNVTLYISHNRSITTRDLLLQASKELKIQPSEYLQSLRQIGGLYGGGPELTILCNLYQRPIHIYEIDSDNDDYTNNSSNHLGPHQPSATGVPTSTKAILPIVEKGTFGHGLYGVRMTDNTATYNNAATYHTGDTAQDVAVVSSSISSDTSCMDGDLHLLVVDVSGSEKHACVLFPVK